ncbi:prepilin-type N-terminal cleavage/methylation domain-containing protein [Chroococcidiopsidales cyanobacterium LEGE 13417]|nr:prepilin-type N-terminal cleavage/methylation domain-containing protein [Chroococcidiopsidales cyanobacterium LEGE 13417]
MKDKSFTLIETLIVVTIGVLAAIAQSNYSGVWSGNYEKPWDYRRTNK